MEDSVGSWATVRASASTRLHYLDWLHVLAVLMVFLFHAVHPFDFGDWHIKNVQQSEVISILLTILGLWGMPFFFLVSGAGSWFSLRRRTGRQYLSERFKRLLVPFIVGTILFRPFLTYLEWMNRAQRGVLTLPWRDYVRWLAGEYASLGFSPAWFGLGEHLWFLGFLFAFALLTLPLFQWLKSDAGSRVVSWLASLSEHRGGLLVFLIPPLVMQFAVRPFALDEHGWGDFCYQMAFFAMGYVLFADGRFTRAIRRDGWLLMALGTAVLLSLTAMYFAGLPVLDWGNTPALPQFYLMQALATVIALCYTLTVIFIGMRFLDFTNQWLRYGQEATLPFFVLHQPAILVIAFFVVQWNAGISAKLLTVVLGSFAVSVGPYELFIRRVRPLRAAFGMTA